MVVIRRNSGMGVRFFVTGMFQLFALMILIHAGSDRGPWFAILLSAMGLYFVVVRPQIELDFGRGRFRTFSFRPLARRSDFKQLPVLDRIQVRDVTYRGGRRSWGDTYSHEVFLMSVAEEKLMICERQSGSAVRRIVQELAQASGLPVRDVTHERVLSNARG